MELGRFIDILNKQRGLYKPTIVLSSMYGWAEIGRRSLKTQFKCFFRLSQIWRTIAKIKIDSFDIPIVKYIKSKFICRSSSGAARRPSSG